MTQLAVRWMTTASLVDTARLAAMVGAPTIAAGVIKRRPKMMALTEKLGLDTRANRLLGQLRAKYGPGPLLLRVPGRTVALVLDAEDVGRVLEGAPEPFTPANREKRGALSHFQPHGVLISDTEERRARRLFVEDALETDQPLHHLAPVVVRKVREEVRLLLAESDGRLDWAGFNRAWWRIVRRITLGDNARDDHEITDLLAWLRSTANWAYTVPRNRAARDRFDQLLDTYTAQAEKDSLAAVAAQVSEGVDPTAQIPHWLFAFDAAGMSSFRALAVLSTHPEQLEEARAELSTEDAEQPRPLAYLRACELESVRLWPTTPAILRDTTEETEWGGGKLPAGATVLVYAPFFHRDEYRLPFADHFTPEAWLDGRAAAEPALVPFSAGPARCPGENLVLLATSTLLAALLEQHDYTIESAHPLEPTDPLPSTLDNFGLVLGYRPRA